MKHALILLLIILILCFTGCSKQPEKDEDTSSLHAEREKILEADTEARDRIEYHRKYKGGKLLYPESYGGYYVEDKTLVVLLIDIDKASEYEYLEDSYLDVEYKEVEYSYNYLQSFIDEFNETDEGKENNFGSHVDVKLNRAMIYINDEETLVEKLVEQENDENSPVIYQKPPKMYVM